MPELPEVETIRRGLSKTILNKRIKGVAVLKKRIVRGSGRALAAALKSHSFAEIDRRGKLLAFRVSDSDKWVFIHLKMTGQLMYARRGTIVALGGHGVVGVDELPNKYSYVIFSFTDGSGLYFNDQRQFGYVQLVSDAQKQLVWETYGPEPLTSAFTWEAFRHALRNRKTMLKAALLNQSVVAGLGNIYVDEVCWHAKVRPTRRIKTLSEVELKALYEACKNVIREAVRYRGTTFSHYRDAQGKLGGYRARLKVYGRDGEACARCGTTIIKKVAAGRGTHFCPNCQR